MDGIKKKILYIVNVDWFFVSHRLQLAIEAVSQGYEVHLATNLTDKGKILASYGIKVHPISTGRAKTSVASILGNFIDIYQVVKTVRPQLLHVITIKPIVYGGLCARLLGVHSLVIAVAGLGYAFSDCGLKSRLLKAILVPIYKYIFQHPNLRVIFQNSNDRATIERVTNINSKSSKLIKGSGVDLNKYKQSPFPSGTAVIVFAARLIRDKGVFDYVEAAALLKKTKYAPKRGVRCIIVGSEDPGNPNSVTNSDIQKWKKDRIVEFLGFKQNIAEIISMAHIVVLPSYYMEGLPKILIEAAACGRPVITTDHPGCRDAIITDVTGMLVEKKNPEQIAIAVKRILDEPGLLEKMGNAGRQLAEENYNINNVVNEHMALYKDLLARSYVIDESKSVPSCFQ